MRIITYTTQRLVLTPDEKRIAKTWGPQWKSMVKSHLKGEKIRLIIGEWSGYRASQRRVVHTSLAPKGTQSGHLGMIKYGDNTTMDTVVQAYSLQEILDQKLEPLTSYTDGVKRMLAGETVVSY